MLVRKVTLEHKVKRDPLAQMERKGNKAQRVPKDNKAKRAQLELMVPKDNKAQLVRWVALEYKVQVALMAQRVP